MRMVRKKSKSELALAEIKFRSLLDKRDAFNDDANVFRDERDSLNRERRELNDKMQTLKEQRDSLVAEMRLHKKERNECQKKGKELIEFRRKKRKEMGGNLGANLERMRTDIENLQNKQETVPMGLKDENLVLEEIKRKKKEIGEFEKLFQEQEKMSTDVKSLDDSINLFFQKADAEHELVVKLSEEAHIIHEKIVGRVKEISHLIAESNKKHEAFSAIREKADYYHNRAMEMREKILSKRKEKREEAKMARDIIRKQNIETREALDSKEKKEKAADDALKTLLEKGKVEMK